MKTIDRFSGEFRFLSNFSPSWVSFDGVKYRTVEHAYQAAKTVDEQDRHSIKEMYKPASAKQAGRLVRLRSGWEGIKLSIMKQLLKEKFKDEKLKEKLLSTDDALLIEGNHWGDIYWGVCNGVGENKLGKLLMEIRNDN